VFDLRAFARFSAASSYACAYCRAGHILFSINSASDTSKSLCFGTLQWRDRRPIQITAGSYNENKFLEEASLDSAKPDGSERSYRPDIDGIRAIAVLSVVFFHAGVPYLTGGSTGVDIFFVISGYLIGGHIFSAACAGKFSFLGFYQRRAKRILPAFYGMLLFTIAAALLLMSPHEARAFAITAVSAVLSASNIYYWHSTDYFTTSANLQPLLNTWSLGVEEQFYAVIPLLMVLLARIRRSLVMPFILIVCVLSFSLAWFELTSHPNNVFYLLPERAWELGAGVALAVIELTRKRIRIPLALSQLIGLVGLALIAAPVFILNSSSRFPGPAVLPSVLGTALLIAAPESVINQKLLSLPPMVFIGKISYSLYLWHWPLLAYLSLASGGQLALRAALPAVGISFVAAVLSYYAIEQPFRRSAMAPGPLLIRYAIASGVMVTLCAAVWLSGGARQRFPELAQMDRDSQILPFDPCLSTNRSAHPRLSAPCFNPTDARPLVAIWGDSHAAALAPGMRSIANDEGYGFVQLTHGVCAPLTGAVDYEPKKSMAAVNCMQFKREALAFLKNTPRVRTVILTAYWSFAFQQDHDDHWIVTDPEHVVGIPAAEQAALIFRQSLQSSIQALQAAGKKVIVLNDVPHFASDPMLNVRTAGIPLRRMLANRLGSSNANDPGTKPEGMLSSVAMADEQLKQVLAQFPGVPLIDLSPEFCHHGNECDYRIGNRILYGDSGHLTPYGASHALQHFHLPPAAGPP
jgi:peptidoglycan/LPS O-acetylase OafA/YrhL